MTKGNNKEAARLVADMKVKNLWENSKGEFFTSENLALLSEGGKKENVYEHTFSGKPDAKVEDDHAKTIEKIGKAKTSESVNDLVNGSDNNKVLDAAEERKLELQMEAADKLIEKISKAKTKDAVYKIMEGVTDKDVLDVGKNKISSLSM
jgi:hypothetical protein